MADARFRCTQAAVLDQKLAGLDVITGGRCAGAPTTSPERSGLDLRTGRVLAQTYLIINGRVKSPAYRTPLHGLKIALPALVGDETLDHDDAQALSDWYTDAVSFADIREL